MHLPILGGVGGQTKAMSDSLDDITCENCIAACCRAPVNMALSAVEFKRHSKTMDLKEIAKPKLYAQHVKIPAPAAPDGSARTRIVETSAGYGLFRLQTGCANLDQNFRCSVYQTRPDCCRTFELRSPMCLQVRREAGLDADRPEPTLQTIGEVARPSSLDDLRAEIFPSFVPMTAEQRPRAVATARLHTPPLGLADLVAVITRESSSVVAQMSRLEAAQWNTPTRCEGWDIATVVSHLVAGHDFTAKILAENDEAIGEASPALEAAENPGRVLVAAFTEANEQLTAQLGRITQERFVTAVDVSGTAATIRHILHVLALELIVHGSDIATALGEHRRFNSHAAQAIAAVLPRLLDEGDEPNDGEAYVLRSETFEIPLTWRDRAWNLEPGSDPCWIEGIAEGVLLFALGRQSFESSQLVTNDPARARNFKRYLPGP